MDVVAFERVHESFREFHAFFVLAFGRKQWREHSKNYLQALLPIRRASTLPETVPASARASQPTEARWDDEAVDASKNTWVPGLTLRRCGCSTAAIFPSRA